MRAVTCFHGTSVTRAKAILKQGLIPYVPNGYSFCFLEPHDDAVLYAVAEGNYSKPIDDGAVIEFPLDESKLEVDGAYPRAFKFKGIIPPEEIKIRCTIPKEYLHQPYLKCAGCEAIVFRPEMREHERTCPELHMIVDAMEF